MDNENENLNNIVPDQIDEIKHKKHIRHKKVFSLIVINIALAVYIVYQLIFLFSNLNK